jgi:hypothetical protein
VDESASDSQKFVDFVNEHNKNYGNDTEKQKRFKIFKENLKRAKQQDDDEAARNPDDPDRARFGVTPFSDLTPEEFETILVKDLDALVVNATAGLVDRSPPESLLGEHAGTEHDRMRAAWSKNWCSTTGHCTAIKNQGSCGSCWDFASVEVVETRRALAGKGLVTLSTQEVLDCSSGSCSGACPCVAMDYFVSKGAQTAASYPNAYAGAKKTCRYSSTATNYKIGAWKWIASGTNNEGAIYTYVYNKGVALGMLNAGLLQNYQSGIITATCSTSVNHAVALVGAGATDTGVTYWRVRNSWGSAWGESGYFRLHRGNNKCGIGLWSLGISRLPGDTVDQF